MEVLALTHAIYWLLGVFAVIGVLVTVWKSQADDLMSWFKWPKAMAYGGCFFMVSSIVAPIIWLAIAILSGFVLYESGMLVWQGVVLTILIAVLGYPVTMFLVSTLTGIIVWLSVWVYYCTLGEIRKMRLRKAKEKKAQAEKNKPENATADDEFEDIKHRHRGMAAG